MVYLYFFRKLFGRIKIYHYLCKRKTKGNSFTNAL